MEESIETYKALDPRGYLSKFTSSNTRPSSRPHHTARRTTLLPTVLPRNTYGSSLTTLGSTQVITGITLQIGTPPPTPPSTSSSSPSNKTQGELNIQVNFSPLSGGQYNTHGRIQTHKLESETGNGTTLSYISYADPQSLESYLKRTILHSDVFDASQLCVKEGTFAWKVNVHCMVVNHDGNIVDACVLGIMTALRDLRLPAVSIGVSRFNAKEEVVQILPQSRHSGNDGNSNSGVLPDVEVTGRHGTPVVFSKMAIPLTVALFDNKLLVDPTLEEEQVSDGMITIVVDSMSVVQDRETKALTGTILSLTKSGGGAVMSGEEIAACVQLAFGRAMELKPIMNP